MSGHMIDPEESGAAPHGRTPFHGPLGAFRLRLPATSANLGPGFDAVAVALDFFLEIEAVPAQEFQVTASGRNADRCGRLEDNLIVATYKQILNDNRRAIVPLAIRMVNGIPLGMGCGSSAAARLAAIALAVHFGKLGWDTERVLEEAYKLEGHPDNVAACWLGGFVTAVCEGPKVRVARTDPPEEWRAIVALPDEPLSTSKARAVLPASYPLEDVVANLQSVAVLALAFAQGRTDLLRLAMRDRIHQPYRAPITPLLPILLPQVGSHGILGIALSGAGPAVLVIVDREESLAGAAKALQKAAESRTGLELHMCGFSRVGACQAVEK
ncbi:MAG: homoserine kinase [Terracidiphilus sp.]|jgi:homoserine kinase